MQYTVFPSDCFEVELQETNTEIIFSLNCLELSGDLNTPNGIREALNGTENKSWKKSEIVEVNHFLESKPWLIQSKAKVL